MAYSISASRIDLEHIYRKPPRTVFAAWSNPDAMRRWAKPGDDWKIDLRSFEFAVGGEQITEFGPPGGPTFVNRTRYQDIVPDTRIVTTGTMTNGSLVLFAGVLSLEFQPVQEGCRLKLIEQGVFLDGHDRPENHAGGWDEMLRRLEDEIAAQGVGSRN